MLIPRDFNEIARQFLAKSCKIRNPGATGKSEPRGLTSDAVVIELTENFSRVVKSGKNRGSEL